MSVQRVLLDRMPEREWQQHVIEQAENRGWRVYFTYRSDRSPEGFPDLVLLKPPHLRFLELKTRRGGTTDAQDEWIAELSQVTIVSAGVYRPSDSDLVLELLGPLDTSRLSARWKRGRRRSCRTSTPASLQRALLAQTRTSKARVATKTSRSGADNKR